MVRYSVVRRTDAQAYNSTSKEKEKGYGIGPGHHVSFECVKRQGDEEKSPSTEKVGVNVDGFIM